MVKVAEKHKAESRRVKLPKLHCGLCQHGLSMERAVTDSLSHYDLIIHKFSTISELYEQNQRSYIDLVVFAAGEDASWISELIREMKSHSILQFIPILVYASGATKDLVVNAYRLGAEELVSGDWDKDIVGAKADMLISRSRRDLSVNPSTKLPGPNAIEYEIDNRLRNGEKFAVCYCDLDNFKAYNDYYGYVYGDKLIRITSHIVRNVV